MKKLLFIIPLLFACKKEEPVQKTDCDCYQQHQVNLYGYYEDTYQTQPVQDLCVLDGNVVQYEEFKRYIWRCE